MKRELKPNPPCPKNLGAKHCRAYPDEKGIETMEMGLTAEATTGMDCRAYPDEKGIETVRIWRCPVQGGSKLQSLSR